MEKFLAPAISVVVPLFNAEKFIGECLDSILAQTFADFEVIVVDDRSTDSSYDIVKSYAPKFGGRLKLSHMEKNSGSGALPRNKGLQLSRGEYVFFVDNDDLITPTALEELHALAKNYDADVVYCDDNYRMNSDGSNVHRENADKQDLVDKPTFESNNMAQRVQRILRDKYLAPQWRKLVRRDLLIEHENFFPDICPSDDDVWTYGLVFCAKKFLRVPNSVYVRRLSEDSIMRTRRTPQRAINFFLNPVLLGLKALDRLMSRHKFFQQNPQYRYAVLEKFTIGKFRCLIDPQIQLPSFEVFETINQSFRDNFGEQQSVLIATLCTLLHVRQKINLVMAHSFDKSSKQDKAYIAELENFIEQAQARIAELEAELNRRQT